MGGGVSKEPAKKKKREKGLSYYVWERRNASRDKYLCYEEHGSKFYCDFSKEEWFPFPDVWASHTEGKKVEDVTDPDAWAEAYKAKAAEAEKASLQKTIGGAKDVGKEMISKVKDAVKGAGKDDNDSSGGGLLGAVGDVLGGTSGVVGQVVAAAGECMSCIKAALAVVKVVRDLYLNVKANHAKAATLAFRVEAAGEALEELKEHIEENMGSHKPGEYSRLEKTVKNLSKVLDDARNVINAWTDLGTGNTLLRRFVKKVKQFVTAKSYGEEFDKVGEMLSQRLQELNTASLTRILCLVDTINDSVTNWGSQNAADAQKDKEALPERIRDVVKNQAKLEETLRGLGDNLESFNAALMKQGIDTQAMLAELQKDIKKIDERTKKIDDTTQLISRQLNQILVREVGEKDKKIKYSHLEVEGTEVEAGAFSRVFRAMWCGTEVAVKKFNNVTLKARDLTNFEREVFVAVSVNHPNIVHTYGACYPPDPPALIMDYHPVSLYHAIGNDDKIPKGPWNTTSDGQASVDGIPWPLRLRIAHGVASGLQFLHNYSPQILHRDIKSPNVLLAADGTPKLCDFGLSKHEQMMSTLGSKREAVGTRAWQAPELHLPKPLYSDKSDVYAFGMVMFELVSGETPFQDMDQEQLRNAVTNDERPDTDELWAPAGFMELMVKCWAPDPHVRPTAASCADELHRLALNKDASTRDMTSPTPARERRAAAASAPAPQAGQVGEDFGIKYSHLRVGKDTEAEKGVYSTVVKGTWFGKEVAVKKFLFGTLKGRDLANFKAEVAVVARLDHVNIAKTYGACYPPDIPALVMEFYHNTLYDILENDVPWPQRLSIALGVASALAFLHQCKPPILHRDIKSWSVLMAEDGTPKLCDCGLAKHKEMMQLKGARASHSRQWQAPELFKSNKHSDKSDVYGFGMLLYELASRDTPFKEVEPDDLKATVVAGERPSLDELDNPPDAFVDFMQKCWDQKPAQRPTAAACVATLQRIIEGKSEPEAAAPTPEEELPGMVPTAPSTTSPPKLKALGALAAGDPLPSARRRMLAGGDAPPSARRSRTPASLAPPTAEVAPGSARRSSPLTRLATTSTLVPDEANPSSPLPSARRASRQAPKASIASAAPGLSKADNDDDEEEATGTKTRRAGRRAPKASIASAAPAIGKADNDEQDEEAAIAGSKTRRGGRSSKSGISSDAPGMMLSSDSMMASTTSMLDTNDDSRLSLGVISATRRGSVMSDSLTRQLPAEAIKANAGKKVKKSILGGLAFAVNVAIAPSGLADCAPTAPAVFEGNSDMVFDGNLCPPEQGLLGSEMIIQPFTEPMNPIMALIENDPTRLREVFSALDRDGNGLISEDELTQMLAVLGVEGAFDVSGFMTQADTDGDGKINYDEFMNVVRDLE